MRAVERDIISKGELELPAQRVSHRLQAGPEQTVMHDQKIDFFLCGLCQNARGNIDRRAETRYASGIFNLQTIERIVPIADLLNAQETVGITNDLSKRRHEASVAAFDSLASAKHALRASRLCRWRPRRSAVSNAEPKDRARRGERLYTLAAD